MFHSSGVLNAVERRSHCNWNYSTPYTKGKHSRKSANTIQSIKNR